MSDYTQLKRLAEASLGEWYEIGELRYEDRSGYINGLHHDDEYFIAAANPAVVLALIADLDEARNGMKHSCAIRLKKGIERLEAERDQLKAENEALRKALMYVRDNADDWHLSEKAADALVDAALSKGEQP